MSNSCRHHPLPDKSNKGATPPSLLPVATTDCGYGRETSLSTYPINALFYRGDVILKRGIDNNAINLVRGGSAAGISWDWTDHKWEIGLILISGKWCGWSVGRSCCRPFWCLSTTKEAGKVEVEGGGRISLADGGVSTQSGSKNGQWCSKHLVIVVSELQNPLQQIMGWYVTKEESQMKGGHLEAAAVPAVLIMCGSGRLMFGVVPMPLGWESNIRRWLGSFDSKVGIRYSRPTRRDGEERGSDIDLQEGKYLKWEGWL